VTAYKDSLKQAPHDYVSVQLFLPAIKKMTGDLFSYSTTDFRRSRTEGIESRKWKHGILGIIKEFNKKALNVILK